MGAAYIVDSEKARLFYTMASEAGERKTVIVGHHNPDGDCIGCLTGMEAWLESAFGKKGVMIVPDSFPDYLKFMYSTDSIMVYSRQKDRRRIVEAIAGADLIICMDFSALSRTEGMGELISKSGAKKVLIDHHPSPEPFADLVFSETEVSSASELTWWILNALGPDSDIPFKAKESLYTGMMTDTNNFCNTVYPSTFLMASQIAEAGVDREKIQMEIMNSFSEDRMRLMGEMLLNRMKMYPDLKAAVMILDKKAKEQFNYRDGDSEGFVNLPLKIKEVEISALFTETDGFIKVSLRSKGAVSVNRLCRRYFNGGGHERASGGRLYMPVEEVEGFFEKCLREFLHSGE